MRNNGHRGHDRKKTYKNHLISIFESSQKYSEEVLVEAIRKVRQFHGHGNDSDILNIAVSFDGSWHKRGHTSKHGVALVIEASTRLVVDYHVMSTYCHVSCIHTTLEYI